MYGFAILVLNRSRDFVDFFWDLNRHINLKPEVIFRSLIIPGNVAAILHSRSLFTIRFSWTLKYNRILATEPKNLTILYYILLIKSLFIRDLSSHPYFLLLEYPVLLRVTLKYYLEVEITTEITNLFSG